MAVDPDPYALGAVNIASAVGVEEKQEVQQ